MSRFPEITLRQVQREHPGAFAAILMALMNRRADELVIETEEILELDVADLDGYVIQFADNELSLRVFKK